MKKIIPILLPGLFSAAEILAALYLKRQIPAGSAGLSMAADLLLYAWIAYNGCSWTIGYKKIFIHGIWFFQEADVLLTRTAKKPFFCLCIPQAGLPGPRRPLSRRRRSPRVQKSCSPVHGGYRFFLPLFHHSFFQSMRTRDTKKATELKNQVSGYAQEMVWNTGTIWMAMET